MNDSRTVLRMTGIGKSFSGVKVLEDVDFTLYAGEVHVLAGENGAGKSTLIRILAGVYQDYEGEVEYLGRTVRFRSPREASEAGISAIHQEISLVGPMSVADNIFLGRERMGRAGIPDRGLQRREAVRILAGLGLELDVDRPVEEYPVPVRQMIEIARALSCEARVIVMDEPTSTLSAPEVERLFGITASLRERGVAVVYISHKMEEIYRIADRITVLRDGRVVGSAPVENLPEPELVRLMVGRELSGVFPARTVHAGNEALRVEDLTLISNRGRCLVENLSFSLREGEILGLAGLQGSGNSAALAAVYGATGGKVSGRVTLHGTPLFLPGAPSTSLSRGLVLLTNDRKTNGIIPEMDILCNISLASLRRFSPGGWLRPARESRAGLEHMRELRIKASSPAQPVGTLSGGNQQKVVLARWLETGPKVLLLDEPTRGVDVAVKQEIYELIDNLSARGAAIVLITSEMSELLGMCDRIIVMSRGRCTAELSRGEATQEKVLQAAMGRSQSAFTGDKLD